MNDSARFEATYYDGRRATPSPGAAWIDVDQLVFTGADTERRWRLDHVTDTQVIARALRVTLHVGDRSDPETPGEELVVGDGTTFEALLAAASARSGRGAVIGARRGARRLGVGAWLLITALAVPLGYWAYTILLPRAHVFVSKEREAALGEYVHDSVIGRWDALADEELLALVQRMTRELSDPLAGYDVRVTLVDEATPNAFALPGGRVVVFRGLIALCESPDALAGVLAHELAHVEERHGLRHLIRSLGILAFAGGVVGGSFDGFEAAETAVELSSGLLALKHSRAHEREADRIAVAKLRAAGRSAAGLAAFFNALQRRVGSDMPSELAWLSTHPLTSDRIATLTALAAETPAGEPWLDDVEWRELRARLAR